MTSPDSPKQQENATAPAPTSEAPANPRLTALATKQAALEATLADLLAERATLIAQTSIPDQVSSDQDSRDKAALSSATATIKHHIATLHRYNEVKDVGQGLLGLVAEARCVRVKDVMEDLGLENGD